MPMHCVVLVLVDGAVGMPAHHACRFECTDGTIRGCRDCPHSVPCKFGRRTVRFWEDGDASTSWRASLGKRTVRGSRDCPCSVPCKFGRMECLVLGGWHCPQTRPCTGSPDLQESDLPSARTLMARSASSPDRVSCLAGSGGQTVLFEAVTIVSALRHASFGEQEVGTTHAQSSSWSSWADGRSGSGQS